MRSWIRLARATWASCAPGATVLAVVALVVLVVTAECDKRERAVHLAGVRAGVAAALDGAPVRWGTCLAAGREYPCAKTGAGLLIEVRLAR